MIVGCGAVAHRLYQKVPDVVALVDPVAGHAASLGGFFPGAARYRDLDHALTSSTPELTLVLSPAHLHCRQVVNVLRHGSHVLCEKPMANPADDCLEMAATAADAKRVLAVGMIRRYFPAFAQL